MAKRLKPSSRVTPLTVSAVGSRAGDESHASLSVLPAATTTLRPAACAAATARSSAALVPPLKLNEATATDAFRRAASSTAHCSPAMTVELHPSPRQSRTPTGTTRARLATPYVCAATTPAQCVPCAEHEPPTAAFTSSSMTASYGKVPPRLVHAASSPRTHLVE